MDKAVNKDGEKDRLLSSEEHEGDDTPRIRYERLPVGVWFIEWIGVLSRVDPIRKKRLYVYNALLQYYTIHVNHYRTTLNDLH